MRPCRACRLSFSHHLFALALGRHALDGERSRTRLDGPLYTYTAVGYASRQVHASAHPRSGNHDLPKVARVQRRAPGMANPATSKASSLRPHSTAENAAPSGNVRTSNGRFGAIAITLVAQITRNTTRAHLTPRAVAHTTAANKNSAQINAQKSPRVSVALISQGSSIRFHPSTSHPHVAIRKYERLLSDGLQAGIGAVTMACTGRGARVGMIFTSPFLQITTSSKGNACSALARIIAWALHGARFVFLRDGRNTSVPRVINAPVIAQTPLHCAAARCQR